MPQTHRGCTQRRRCALTSGGGAAKLCAVQLDDHTRRDLYRLGLREIGPPRPGQNLVVEASFRGRHVVGKARSEQGRYRLDKEADWLVRARALGLRVPRVLAVLRGPRLRVLLLSRAPGRSRHAAGPAQWRERLAPLHAAAPPTGWGPLRADGRPRWASRRAAADWYRSLAQRLDAEQAQRCAALVGAFFAAARPSLIHGDPHAGNLRGDMLLDWEHVAVGDPLEDAARAWLAGGWAEATWCRAWGVDPSETRWRGACCCAALEAARFGGPRTIAGLRWLDPHRPRA